MPRDLFRRQSGLLFRAEGLAVVPVDPCLHGVRGMLRHGEGSGFAEGFLIEIVIRKRHLAFSRTFPSPAFRLSSAGHGHKDEEEDEEKEARGEKGFRDMRERASPIGSRVLGGDVRFGIAPVDTLRFEAHEGG